MEKLESAKTELEKDVRRIINENAEGYENMEGYVSNLLRHGCISGMVGELIYYKDTTAFYERHKYEIWELIIDMADDMGYKNPLEFLATLNGAKDIGNADQFENLLAWFAFEETAKKLAERNGMEV